MRSMTARFFRRLAREERGFSLVYLTIWLVVIMGAASLVIDLGNGWRTRRALIPATDSAALAAAQEYAYGRDGCAGMDDSYLSQNESTASVTACTPNVSGSRVGWVSVSGTQNVDTWFAPILGFGDYPADSTSIAAIGPPSTVTGLRPIGLCFEGNVDLQNLILNPPAGPTLLTIPYDKDQPSDCGSGASNGNWGIVDFDGTPTSNPETADWMRNGYDGEVSFANHTVSTCVGEPHCYPGGPGADFTSGPVRSAMDWLILNDVWFTIPVFNFHDDPSGANERFHMMGVLRVQLEAYSVTGNPPPNTDFFQFLVEPGLITGTCCGGGGESSGNRVIALCGVDPNATAACP